MESASRTSTSSDSTLATIENASTTTWAQAAISTSRNSTSPFKNHISTPRSHPSPTQELDFSTFYSHTRNSPSPPRIRPLAFPYHNDSIFAPMAEIPLPNQIRPRPPSNSHNTRRSTSRLSLRSLGRHGSASALLRRTLRRDSTISTPWERKGSWNPQVLSSSQSLGIQTEAAHKDSTESRFGSISTRSNASAPANLHTRAEEAVEDNEVEEWKEGGGEWRWTSDMHYYHGRHDAAAGRRRFSWFKRFKRALFGPVQYFVPRRNTRRR
ncbi:uncharacterized protein VTP21DRAFT_10074 [Calcarisporiella thermophila]|uniref:uncharacterized protein n=1 Tax=Calcarisporiella thermophila TaxID=911321 RepID=UPI003742BD56